MQWMRAVPDAWLRIKRVEPGKSLESNLLVSSPEQCGRGVRWGAMRWRVVLAMGGAVSWCWPTPIWSCSIQYHDATLREPWHDCVSLK